MEDKKFSKKSEIKQSSKGTHHYVDLSDAKTMEEFYKRLDEALIKGISEQIEKLDKAKLYVQEIYNVINTHKENAVSILTHKQIYYGNKILSELHLTNNSIKINTPEGIKIFNDCYEKYHYKIVEIIKNQI